MARKFATVTSDIWRDVDFKRLTVDAQYVYLMLITQPDISSCGLLSITPTRWSQYASDMPIDRLSNALRTLSDERFILVDNESQELLIRKFVKWDGGYRNPKRLMAVLSAASGIYSVSLMQVMAHELEKLGVDHGLEVTPIDSHSIGDRLPIDTPRIPVTLRTKNLNPESGILKPEAPSPAAPATESGPSEFDEFWEVYPRKVGKEAAHKAFANALKRTDFQTIIDGAQRVADDPNLPEKQFIKHPATWLNSGGWDDESFPPRIRNIKSISDQPWTPPPGSPLSYVEL